MTLVDRAEGADPVGGQVLELGAGGDAVVGVALRGIILIPADVANILFHIIVVLKVNISKCKDTTIFLYGKKYFHTAAKQKCMLVGGALIMMTYYYIFDIIISPLCITRNSIVIIW